MYILGSADETNGSHAEALFIIRFLSGFNQAGAVAQAKVVVGAHAEKLSAVLHFYSCALGGHEGRLAFKETGFFNGFHFFCINA